MIPRNPSAVSTHHSCRPGLLLALLLASCAGSAPAVEPRPQSEPDTRPEEEAPIGVAVTIDDLPWVGGVAPGDASESGVRRMLAALEVRRAPVTGFVTCHNAEGHEDALAAWLASDMGVGNHSDTHRAFDELGLAAWRQDIEDCQARIGALNGESPTYYRYPFLQTGADAALRDQGFEVLEALSLRRAPVSIDTSEWALLGPYLAARQAGDEATVTAIGRAYVDHLRRATRHYLALAAELGHARAPQVLLLHANALAADHLDAVLGMLEDEGLVFVTLDDALADPLYALEDHYVGNVGLSWLHRIEGSDSRRWAWDAAQMHAMQVRFDGRDERAEFNLDQGLSVRRDPEGYVISHEGRETRIDAAGQLESPLSDASTSRSVQDWLEARFGMDRD